MLGVSARNVVTTGCVAISSVAAFGVVWWVSTVVSPLGVPDPVAAMLGGLAAVVTWAASFDLMSRSFARGWRSVFRVVRPFGEVMLGDEELLLGRLTFAAEFESAARLLEAVRACDRAGLGALASVLANVEIARREGRLAAAAALIERGVASVSQLDRAELLFEGAVLFVQLPGSFSPNVDPRAWLWEAESLTVAEVADADRLAYVRGLGEFARAVALATSGVRADLEAAEERLLKLSRTMRRVRSLRARRLAELARVERMLALVRNGRPYTVRAQMRRVSRRVALRSVATRLADVSDDLRRLPQAGGPQPGFAAGAGA